MTMDNTAKHYLLEASNTTPNSIDQLTEKLWMRYISSSMSGSLVL